MQIQPEKNMFFQNVQTVFSGHKLALTEKMHISLVERGFFKNQ